MAPCDACGGILELTPSSCSPCINGEFTSVASDPGPSSLTFWRTIAKPTTNCGICGAVNAIGDDLRGCLGLPFSAAIPALQAAEVQARLFGHGAYLRVKREELRKLYRALGNVESDHSRKDGHKFRTFEGVNLRSAVLAWERSCVKARVHEEDDVNNDNLHWTEEGTHTTTPRGLESGPPTLGSVQCAQAPVETDTPTYLGARSGVESCRDIAGGHRALHTRGTEANHVGIATAAPLLAVRPHHVWEGPGPAREAEDFVSQRERQEAALLRCQMQIAWLEDLGGHQSLVGARHGTVSSPVLNRRPFMKVDLSMLAVCLDACGGETRPLRGSILSRAEAFLSSRPSIRKLRRRSKILAGVLRQCRADAAAASRSSASADGKASFISGEPVTCGFSRGRRGQTEEGACEVTKTMGLLGRLLQEEGTLARVNMDAMAHPHAALLDSVNTALDGLFCSASFSCQKPSINVAGCAAAASSSAKLLLQLHGDVHTTLIKCER